MISRLPDENYFFFYLFSSHFRLNILQYANIPFCGFNLVVKCRTSNLRALGSNPDMGTQCFPSFFQFSLIFNKPRGLWAPVFLLFTVINCKTPLCSFNNTFNTWFTFVDPPTYPHPDLIPDWTPPPRPRLFQFYNIFNSWFTSTRTPTQSLLSILQ